MKHILFTFLGYLPHRYIALIACIMVIVGLYTGRAIMSIGMIVLIANAVINLKVYETWSYFKRQPVLWLLSGYYLLVAMSFFWSKDYTFLSSRLQVLLPFAVLPFAFASIGKWEAQWYHLLFLVYILCNVIGVSWTLYHYLLNKDMYDAGYSFSHSLRTPFKGDHIRFSIAVVLSCLFSSYLISYYKKWWIRLLLILALAYSVVFLHILAAKTGLVSLYLATIILIVNWLRKPAYRNYAVAILFLLIITPFVMFHTSKTLRNKIGYFMYSIDQMVNNKEDQSLVSDEGRLISYKYAMELIKKHPIAGVGYGDAYAEMENLYKRDFGTKEYKVLLPHNQFLMSFMSLGLIGFLYVVAIFIALFRKVKQNDLIYMSFLCVCLFACLIEPFFENQYGLCMFLFFILLLLQRKNPVIDHSYQH